jgi:hypothetical protein
MSTSLAVFLVEDDPDVRESVVETLNDGVGGGDSRKRGRDNLGRPQD